MELSKREKRRVRLEKVRQESREAQQEYEQRVGQLRQSEDRKQKSLKSKYILIGVLVGILTLAIASYSIFSLARPGPYDSFAKCLNEKEAVMYGAMDWCKYTQAQKGMFGKSFKYINYYEYQELPGIKKTPTWVINGKWYENVQSFERLSELTGCRI